MDKIKKFAPLAGAALVLISVLLIFAPVIKDADSYTGLKTAFGYYESGYSIIGFSLGNVLAYVLAIAGIALAVLSVVSEQGDKVSLIAAACMLIAGLFFFLQIQFISGGQFLNGAALDSLKKNAELGAAPIFAGILSILGAACSACPFILKKLGK